MAEEKKRYKLKHGKHYIPDPNFVIGKDAQSHVLMKPGEYVELTDDQYKAFHDKFEPAEGSASAVADDDAAVYKKAQATAAATGQTTNPN